MITKAQHEESKRMEAKSILGPWRMGTHEGLPVVESAGGRIILFDSSEAHLEMAAHARTVLPEYHATLERAVELLRSIPDGLLLGRSYEMALLDQAVAAFLKEWDGA